MKKSELKQLIREVVREVYSQQDEGFGDIRDKIGDFLADPTGRKQKAWDAARREEEKPKNEKFKKFKDTIQHNLKSIPKYVEAFTAKAREAAEKVQNERPPRSSGPQYHQGNGYYSRDAGQDYEYWEKRDDREEKAADTRFKIGLASLQRRYENIKQFIDYIQGQFKTDIEKLEQLDSYDSVEEFILSYGENFNKKIDRIEEFCSEYTITRIGYENEFKKINNIL